MGLGVGSQILDEFDFKFFILKKNMNSKSHYGGHTFPFVFENI